MKNLFESLAVIPAVLFMALNALGGIVGGLWLIFVGDWEIVLFAVFMAIIYPYIFSIVSMIIQFPLVGGGAYFLKRGWNFIAYPMFYLSILSLDVISLVWIYYSFDRVLKGGESGIIFPFLLVAYSLAVSPYTYMAKGEDRDSVATNTAIMFISFSSILYAIGWFFYPYPVVGGIMAILIVILMLFKQFVQFSALRATQRAERELGSVEA